MRFSFALLACLLLATIALAQPAVKTPSVTADLATQLSRAIAAGDAPAVTRLMKRGARPDDETLEIAIYRAPLPIWKALFDGGLSVNAPVKSYDEFDRVARTPLIVAVAGIAAANASYEDADKYPHVGLLRLLIARGADVNARTPGGAPALYAAAGNGKIAGLLLDAGARVEKDDAWLLENAAKNADAVTLKRALQLGVSATSQAAQQRHLLQAALDIRHNSMEEQTPVVLEWEIAPRREIVRALLDAGADPNDFDQARAEDDLDIVRGVTPLMLAADGGLRPDLVELLLERGADPKLQKPGGPNIWEFVVSRRFYSARQLEAIATAERAQFGADIDIEGMGYQRVPIDLAQVERLIEAGAPLEARDSGGLTPLMRAALFNRAEIIAFLAKRGADVNATEKAGNNALLLAVGNDSPDAIGALLDAGANTETRNSGGLTPLLVAAGADVRGVTYYGPLSMAVDGAGGGPEALQMLAKRGANLGARAAKGATALHYVVAHGDTKSAQLLVQRGADVNARGDNGVTALHIATRDGDYSMAKLLLSLGADATIKAQNLTPLELARKPYVTKPEFVGEDPAHPSRETREIMAQLAQTDRVITAGRGQIAALLRRLKR